jgi:hypothetical protein
MQRVWKSKGRIFDPAAHDWAGSHAQVPTPLVYDDKVRVFYADRDKDGKSYTTYVDLDPVDLGRVVYAHKQPILPLGEPGTFDDDGVMPAYALREGGRTLMYYSGWNRGCTVPYRNSTGLAVSDDDGDTWRRLYEGPVLERCPTEPYLAVTPTILKEGDLWRMWYISGLRWTQVEGKYEPVYAIKYASSGDGVSWERPGAVCVPQNHPEEAFSHPTVIKAGGRYHMWYCFRDSRDYRDGAGAYRIGYANSPDGLEWTRLDAFGGLDASGEFWCSTMTCYPFVTQVRERTVMFFNGNGFGQTGFGYAVLEETA